MKKAAEMITIHDEALDFTVTASTLRLARKAMETRKANLQRAEERAFANFGRLAVSPCWHTGAVDCRNGRRQARDHNGRNWFFLDDSKRKSDGLDVSGAIPAPLGGMSQLVGYFETYGGEVMALAWQHQRTGEIRFEAVGHYGGETYRFVMPHSNERGSFDASVLLASLPDDLAAAVSA